MLLPIRGFIYPAVSHVERTRVGHIMLPTWCEVSNGLCITIHSASSGNTSEYNECHHNCSSTDINWHSYQYRKSPLHNRNSYTGKASSLYWIGPLILIIRLFRHTCDVPVKFKTLTSWISLNYWKHFVGFMYVILEVRTFEYESIIVRHAIRQL